MLTVCSVWLYQDRGKFKGQEYRRVPFSVKKKKEQLQQKRAQKLRQNEVGASIVNSDLSIVSIRTT